MNRESDNFTAEVLLKHLGTQLTDQGTTFAGAAVVRRILTEQQIPVVAMRIVDGSGLSRLNRLTPAMLVAMLQRATPTRSCEKSCCRRSPWPGGRERCGVACAARRRPGASGPRPGRRESVGPVEVRQAALRVRNLQNGSPVSTYWARRARGRTAVPGTNWLLQIRFGQDRHARLLGLLQLRPRLFADDQPRGLFGDRVADLGPLRLERSGASSRVNDSSVPVIT